MRQKSKLRRFFLPSFLVLTAVAAVSSGFVAETVYEDHLKEERTATLSQAQRLSELIAHELSIREYSIQALKLLFESLMEGQSPLSWDPIKYLVADEKGYSLALPPGFSANQIGNVTGLGTPPRPKSLQAREIETAISLTPLFRALLARDPDTPWVYYTSFSGMMYLYPRTDLASFRFTDEVYNLNFMKRARGEVNPTRSTFWTPIYTDTAGKGLMVTTGAPVYRGDQLLGVISADITIAKLRWLLKMEQVDYSQAYLQGADGSLMIGTTTEEVPSVTALQNQPGVPFKVDGKLITRFPILKTGWSLVVYSDLGTMRRHSLLHSLPTVAIALTMAAITMLLFTLTRSFRMVETLSTKDHLTGLLNRRVFDSTLEEETERLRRFGGCAGLVIFDVDDFKKYNDAFGHQEGDRALAAVAQAARSVMIRSTDRLFRIGGEEFAAIFPVEDEERLWEAMQKMVRGIAAMELPHPTGTHGIVTVSMGGVLLRTRDGVVEGDFHKQADEALYRAKRAGKNQAVLHRDDATVPL